MLAVWRDIESAHVLERPRVGTSARPGRFAEQARNQEEIGRRGCDRIDVATSVWRDQRQHSGRGAPPISGTERLPEVAAAGRQIDPKDGHQPRVHDRPREDDVRPVGPSNRNEIGAEAGHRLRSAAVDRVERIRPVGADRDHSPSVRRDTARVTETYAFARNGLRASTLHVLDVEPRATARFGA